ncbi:hypothetical protein ANCDUO_14683 [Ancylostoma duodenale]|uniref:Uncharacterized protein n=1 Tax=Ancylostoma duodenale TaxID=51022 RepID=A0A0C2GDI9_9BILA|nr:hypothetical protein ANCDUO_14683 [Ancylostoma duodenale]
MELLVIDLRDSVTAQLDSWERTVKQRAHQVYGEQTVYITVSVCMTAVATQKQANALVLLDGPDQHANSCVHLVNMA